MTTIGLYNYWIVFFLMMAGLYVVIVSTNLIKKIIGLNIFQTSVFILYISIGKVTDGTAPILADGISAYSNPLPHVLMLTAIVVGVSTLGVALAVSQSIFRDFGSLEEDEILAKIKQGGPDADV